MVSARPSVPRLAAILLAISLGLGGCSATNPVTTNAPYAASDGVQVALGKVTGENLLVLSTGTGSPAALQGALSNRGTDDVTVTISIDGGSDPAASIDLAAGATVLLGGTQGDEVLFTSPAPAGALVNLTLTTGTSGAQTIAVPVLDGTLPEYATLVPTAAEAPAPETPATPTAEPSESAEH